MTARACAPFALAVAALLPLAGCGGDKPAPPPVKLPTFPVSGLVKYEGKPVANTGVTFLSIDGKVSASGTTDSAGSFRLSTYGEDGVPAGAYKVVISASGAGGPAVEVEPGVLAPMPADDDQPKKGAKKSSIPVKYADPGKTDLSAVVKDSGSNSYIFELTK